MNLIELLWIVSTLVCAGSVIGMLYVYHSFEESLYKLLTIHQELHQDYTDLLRDLVIKEQRSDYECGVQRVAKDTEVEQ